MLLSADVVLAVLYAAQGLDLDALWQLLSSSVLVYALCTASMLRARQLAGCSGASLPAVQQDALIQGVQGLMLSLYAAALQLPLGSRSRRALEQLLDDGDRWLAQSRQCYSAGQLEQQLLALPRRAGWPDSMAYRVSIQGRARPLPPAIQQSCLQLVQCLLEQHARYAEVELCFGRDQLRLLVRHDGALPQGALLERALPPAHPVLLQVWAGPQHGVELALAWCFPPRPVTAYVARAARLLQRLYPS